MSNGLFRQSHAKSSVRSIPPEISIVVSSILDNYNLLCFQRENTGFAVLKSPYACITQDTGDEGFPFQFT